MTDATTAATVTVPTKGIKTSEFWLALAAMLLTAAFASGLIPSGSTWDKALAFVAAALTSAGYSVGRSMVKSA